MESQEEKDILSVDASNVQEVIGLLLPQHVEEGAMSEIILGTPDETGLKCEPVVPLSSVALTEAGLSLVEPGDYVEEGQEIQLEDGTTAFVQALNEESSGSEVLPRFFDGQAVQLEDGTTAYIHTTAAEGLHAVQLEDGSTAYISAAPPALFDGEASSLGLESSQGSDQENEKQTNVKTPSRTKPGGRTSSLAGEKAFKCEYEGCGRFYSTQHHLKVHERSHTGDRPFVCQAFNCKKTFTTSYGLKSHVRVHTGETPYKCPDQVCLKAFKTSGDLQKHVRIHTGERPFKCPFEGCDRAFTTSNIQKVHIRTHTGERPYICNAEGCNRAFASATNYKNHIRIHTGEKPYVCTVTGCDKRFTEYSSLYKHHVVHTHNRPYTCFVCGRHYRQTSTLSLHKRTMHGIMDNGDEACLEPAITLDENSMGSDCKPEEILLADRETLRKKTRLKPSDIGEDMILDQDSSHGEESSDQHFVVVTLPADMISLEQLAKDTHLGQLTTNSDGSISLQVAKENMDPLSPLTISTQDDLD